MRCFHFHRHTVYKLPGVDDAAPGNVYEALHQCGIHFCKSRVKHAGKIEVGDATWRRPTLTQFHGVRPPGPTRKNPKASPITPSRRSPLWFRWERSAWWADRRDMAEEHRPSDEGKVGANATVVMRKMDAYRRMGKMDEGHRRQAAVGRFI